MSNDDFAGRLQMLRQRAGLTVAQLARRAGMHRVVVHNLENRRNQPMLETAQRLAGALGVSLEAFNTSKELTPS